MLAYAPPDVAFDQAPGLPERIACQPASNCLLILYTCCLMFGAAFATSKSHWRLFERWYLEYFHRACLVAAWCNLPGPWPQTQRHYLLVHSSPIVILLTPWSPGMNPSYRACQCGYCCFEEKRDLANILLQPNCFKNDWSVCVCAIWHHTTTQLSRIARQCWKFSTLGKGREQAAYFYAIWKHATTQLSQIARQRSKVSTVAKKRQEA